MKIPSPPEAATLTRRQTLLGGGALAAASMLGALGCRAAVSAAAPKPAPAAPPTRPLAIDLHNHVYPAGTEPKRGPRGGGAPKGGPPQDEGGEALSLRAALQRSELDAVCASFVLDFANNVVPGDARTNYLRWLSAIDAELAQSHVKRALSLRDLEQAHARGEPTIIQTVEGAHFVEGRLERIDEVYQRGLRHLQLLHESDDLVAPLGDTNTGVAHLGGLTPTGAEVVEACNRLGIVVDLAHASAATVQAALRISKHPVVVSHTNLDTWTGRDARLAAMMQPRLLGKELAKQVAEAGGVVGVWTHLTASLQEYVESIKTMVDAIGAEHVGVGTDTDLLSSRPGHGTTTPWPGATGGFASSVIAELGRQGFTTEEVRQVMGANYARVFGVVTKASG